MPCRESNDSFPVEAMHWLNQLVGALACAKDKRDHEAIRVLEKLKQSETVPS